MHRFIFAFGTLAITLRMGWLLQCWAQSNSPAVPTHQVHDGPVDEIVRIHLTGLIAGKKVHQSVLLENKSSTSLALDHVDVSCDCIDAKVPKKEMRSGAAELLEFDFKTDARLDSIEQSHTITVRCQGARKNLIFVFSGKVEGYLGFRRKDATQSFWKGDDLVSYSIRLLASEGMDLQGVEVRVPESVGFAKAKIELEKETPIVRLELRPSQIDSDSMLLPLQLVRKGVAIADFDLHLNAKEKFEILPTPLIFTPVFSQNIVRTSSAMLRMRFQKGETAPTIHKIICTTADGVKLPVDFKLLRDGVYRIKVDVVETEDMTKSTDLKWEFVTTEGSFQTNTKSILSN